VIGVVSAKGSPGVTTTAAALVAAAVDGLLIELDPSGGSIGSWCGDAGEAGLLALASRLRRPDDHGVWGEATAEPLRGVRTVVAPTAEPQARATVEAIAGRIGVGVRGQLPGVVVVDAGRWSPSQASAARVTGCDVVAMVCRSTTEGIEAARWMLDPLAVATSAPVVLVLVGEGPYRAEEIAGVLGAPVAATIAWDPSAVASLQARGVGGRWHRTNLARSARAALDSLGAFTSSWLAVDDG
jgi:hypothetical protein